MAKTAYKIDGKEMLDRSCVDGSASGMSKLENHSLAGTEQEWREIAGAEIYIIAVRRDSTESSPHRKNSRVNCSSS